VNKLPIDERISISNHSIPVLNNLASCSLHCTEVDRSLLQLAKDTRVFLRDMNDRVIFTRADKGNVTVALDRQMYISKVNMAALVSSVSYILDVFNSQHSRLQFTMEVGGDRLNFLDVTVIRDNELIEFDWYHKPTFSGRYLNFWSQHTVSQKIGTIAGLVDRVILLSIPKFHFDNLCFVINVLLENDYPLSFIFENINNRLKNIIMARRRGLLVIIALI
ncbi:hypothetical protein ALC57_03751, partial [Trachymyrmex cornetzi]